MTNRAIHNPYLRALVAREIVGYRSLYARCKLSPRPMTHSELDCMISAALGLAGRVDLHLRRYPVAVVAGDTAPLADYPGRFAGHG